MDKEGRNERDREPGEIFFQTQIPDPQNKQFKKTMIGPSPFRHLQYCALWSAPLEKQKVLSFLKCMYH